MPRKLLITGASGFLGYHLMRVGGNYFEVYGLFYSNPFKFDSVLPVHCDITNYINLENLFEDIEPDAVIHAAAISNSDFCQTNKKLSYAVNVEATKNLAGICSDYNIPFAFVSTDLVSDGKMGMYKEDSLKNPVSIYREHKSVAENEVLNIYPQAVVFRIPLMFGYPKAISSNYTRKFISQLRNIELATLFTDEYRTPCGAKSIAEGILNLIRQKGIIHLRGKKNCRDTNWE